MCKEDVTNNNLVCKYYSDVITISNVHILILCLLKSKVKIKLNAGFLNLLAFMWYFQLIVITGKWLVKFISIQTDLLKNHLDSFTQTSWLKSTISSQIRLHYGLKMCFTLYKLNKSSLHFKSLKLVRFFSVLKEISYAYQGCIYLIKYYTLQATTFLNITI